MSKSQINLPKTAFSMKANLPTREPEILKFWQNINLYDELRKSIADNAFLSLDQFTWKNYQKNLIKIIRT